MEFRARQAEVTAAWRRDERTIWRRSGSRMVLLAPEHEQVIVLEDVSALIWELLGEPIEQGELVTLLAGHFEVDPVEVRGQVEAFLDQLDGFGAARRA